MNRKLIIALCAIGMFFWGTCSALAADKYKKVKNGGFEEVENNIPKHWTISGQKSALSFDEDEVNEGMQSVLINFKESSAEGIKLWMAIDVEATKRYDFAGSLKTEDLGQGFAEIYVEFFDRDKNIIEKIGFNKSFGTTDWNDFHMWHVAPNGADSAHVVCFAIGKGKVWFDDIRFTGKLQGGY